MIAVCLLLFSSSATLGGIHSEIQGIDGVSTNSIGSEDNRKIVIFLDDRSAAAHAAPAEEEPDFSDRELY